MSNKTNLSDFDPELLGEYDALHIKKVVTVNDGDTLAIVDSDGLVKEMGNLLPTPAKNLTDISLNEAGELIFSMDDGDLTYNAGEFVSREEIQENFPTGLGLLTSDGSLKEFVGTEDFFFSESENEVTISLAPFEGTIVEPLPNIENVEDNIYLETTFKVEETGTSGEYASFGNEYLFKENVSIKKGTYKMILNASSPRSSTLDIFFKDASTDVLIKHFKIEMTYYAVMSQYEILRELKLPKDVVVNISFRYSTENGTPYLFMNDNVVAYKEFTIATMKLEKINIDVSDMVQYEEPEEFKLLKERTNEIGNYLDSLPADYVAEPIFQSYIQNEFRDLYEYDGKIFQMWLNGTRIRIYDEITKEVEYIEVEQANYPPTNTFRKGNLIYIVEANKSNVRSFNLETREVKFTDYRRTGGKGWWDYSLNTICFTGSASGNWTGTYYYISNPNEQPFTKKLTDLINDMPDRTVLLDHTARSSSSNFVFPVDYKPGNLHFREWWCHHGILSRGMNASFLYETETEAGIIETLLPIPQSYTDSAGDTNDLGGFLFDDSRKDNRIVPGRMISQANLDNYSAMSRNEKDFVNDPIWWRVHTSDNRLMTLTGIKNRFLIPSSTANSRDTVKKVGVYATNKPTFATSNISTSSFAADILNTLPVREGYDTGITSTNGSSFDFDFNSEIELRNIALVTKLSLGSATYKRVDSAIIETSLDGETWTSQDYESNLNKDIKHPARYDFDEIEVLGLRLTFPGDTTYVTLYGFAPVELIDGKFKKRNLTLVDFETVTEQPFIYTGSDGSTWQTSPVYRDEPNYSARGLFSGTGGATIHREIEGDVPSNATIMYPSPRKVNGIYYLSASNQDAVLEYTLDGITWINLTDIAHNSYPRTALNRLTDGALNSRHVDEDVVIKTLVEPVTARYLRLSFYTESTSAYRVHRLKVNALTEDDYELVKEIETPKFRVSTPEDPAVTEYLFDEPIKATSVQVKVLESHSPTVNGLHVGSYELMSDDPVIFKGNIYNKETFEMREYFDTYDFSKETNPNVTMSLLNSHMVNSWLGYIYNYHTDENDKFKRTNNAAMVGFIKRGEELFYVPSTFTVDSWLYRDKGEYLNIGATSLSFWDVELGKRDILFDRRNFIEIADTHTSNPYYIKQHPVDNDVFISENTYGTGINIFNPYLNSVSEVNKPMTSKTDQLTGQLYGKPFYDHVRDIFIFPSNKSEGFMAMLPVGVEAKRRRWDNIVDGSVGYLALPDTDKFPDTFVQMHYFNEHSITDLFYDNKPLMENAAAVSRTATMSFSRKYISQPKLLLSFNKPIIFNALDVFSEKEWYTDYGIPLDMKIYSSLDGEEWTLLADLDFKQMGYNGSIAKWYPRIQLEKTTAKYLKLESSSSMGYKTALDFGAVVPIIDEEMFITDEYNRAVKFTGLGDQSVELENSLFTHVVKVNENDFYIYGETSLKYSIDTGAFTALAMEDEQFYYDIFKTFEGPDGKTIVYKKDGSFHRCEEDGTYTELPVTQYPLAHSVSAGKNGDYYFTSAVLSELVIINFITYNKRLENMYLSKIYGQTLLTDNKVVVVPLRTAPNANGIRYYDIALGGTYTGTVVDISSGIGFREIFRLSKGDFLMVPQYIQNNSAKSNFYMYKTVDGNQDASPLAFRLNEMGA